MTRIIPTIVVLLCTGEIAATSRGEGLEPLASETSGNHGDEFDLVFFAPSHPVFVSLRVQVGEGGVGRLRRSFAESLLKTLDRDADGVLNNAEAPAVPSFGLAAASNGVLGDEWQRLDADADGLITTDELATHVNSGLGEPLTIATKPRRPSQAVNLLSRLDMDQDGQLSESELTRYHSSLRTQDFDEDEAFSTAELLPFQDPFEPQPQDEAVPALEIPFVALDADRASEPSRAELLATAQRLIARYDTSEPRSRRLTAAQLGLTDESVAAHDADGDVGLDADELLKFLQEPVAHVELQVQLSDQSRTRPTLRVRPTANSTVAVSELSPASRDTLSGTLSVDLGGSLIDFKVRGGQTMLGDSLSFYQLQFRIADSDQNKYLNEQEYANVQFRDATFSQVDRDADEKIFWDELKTSIDQQALLSRSRVVMTVGQDGKTLFELLDTNFDFRLSAREFLKGFAHLAPLDRNQDRRVAATELAGRWTVTIELGRPELFRNENPMAMQAAAGNALRLPETSSGPLWFQKMDKNRDGDVSPREFLGPPKTFEKLDRDRDRLIDETEASRAAETGQE